MEYIKYIKSLYIKKYRDDTKQFVIEGQRFVDEIPDDWEVEFYFVSKSFAEKHSTEQYAQRAKVLYAEDSSFKKISDTVSPQGILAVCVQKCFGYQLLDEVSGKKNPFFVILEQINDPGNLGAIIRTADAAGASGILLSEGCTDVYNPKVLRSAAGSIFHLPFWERIDIIEWIQKLQTKDIKIYAAHLQGAAYPYNLDLKVGCGFVIGNEARGLSAETAQVCNARIKIPIIGKAESLNASVACGILAYEIVRQRLT